MSLRRLFHPQIAISFHLASCDRSRKREKGAVCFGTASTLGSVGLLLFAGGLAMLAFLPAHPATLDVVWRMALSGAGFGLFQSPNNRTMIAAAPRERSGGASGMLGTARLLGQTIGAALVALLLAISGGRYAGSPSGRCWLRNVCCGAQHAAAIADRCAWRRSDTCEGRPTRQRGVITELWFTVSVLEFNQRNALAG
jgi:MFS family permease